MNRFVAAVAVAGLAVPAMADIVASRPYIPNNTGGTPRVDDYMWDDGTAENSIGISGAAGASLAWATQFNITPGLNTITGINVSFGTPAASNGAAVTAYIWSDPNGDGSPADAMVLASVPGVVSGAADGTPSSLYFPFDLPDTTLPDGTSFFVGIVMQNQMSGWFPAGIDQSNAPHPLGRTWAGFAAQGAFDPNAWASVTDINSIPSLAGRWMIRADAVPAPGALALVGLAGLCAGRRRR